MSSRTFKVKDGILLKYNGKCRKISIPEEITVIGEDDFSYCDSIETVIIPSSVTSIGACIQHQIH